MWEDVINRYDPLKMLDDKKDLFSYKRQFSIPTSD